MFDFFCYMTKQFPRVNIKLSHNKKLKFLNPEIDPAQYNAMAIISAVVFSVVVFIFIEEIIFSLLTFVLTTVFFFILPVMEMNTKKSEIEMAFPFFLRNFGMLIDMGIDFQKAMFLSIDGHCALEKEIKIVIKQVEGGMSMQKALAGLAISFDSVGIKRALSQLITLYESGGSGKDLRKMGDELISLEQHKLKEYAAKSSMFGLLFVMASSVLPTFFMVYAITGRMGFGNDITKEQLTIALLIIFPAISIVLLMISKMVMPRSMFINESWFDVRLLLPPILIIVGVFLPEFMLIFFCIGTIMGLYLTVENYKKEKNIEDIEEKLPDALFTVSSMPKSVRFDRIFHAIEDAQFGALSEETAKSRKQLNMNIGITTVLDDLAGRNKSKMLGRACVMMKQMVETNSLNLMSNLADDMIRNIQIKRERSQLLATQKYTLMAGAVLVPMIAKIALNLMATVSEAIGKEGIDTILINCNVLVPPYLVIYTTIVAIAIADSEGKKSAIGFYSIGLAIISLVSFYFINL
ncbi:MAG: type II secretion system F family protein [Candidatus Micrarchaeota archaeon]